MSNSFERKIRRGQIKNVNKDIKLLNKEFEFMKEPGFNPMKEFLAILCGTSLLPEHQKSCVLAYMDLQRKRSPKIAKHIDGLIKATLTKMKEIQQSENPQESTDESNNNS